MTRGPQARRILWSVALMALFATIYGVKISTRMRDFEVYRIAGIRARAAEPLYRADDGHYQFKYLPAFAVAAVPFGVVPEPIAKATWYATSAGLLVGLLALSLRILPERRRANTFLMGGTVVLLGKFYAHELELGQVNILMAFLVVAGASLLKAGREWAAGLLIAGAVVVKPYAVLFLPYLAARRRVASLLTAAAGLAVALFLPAALYGVDGNAALLSDWWRTVTETTAPNLLDRNNVSAASVFTRWIGPGPTANTLAAVLVLALLLVVVFVYLSRHGVSFPEGLEIGLLLTIMPIVSPQGWDYVFLISTPAVMYLLNYADALPSGLRVAVVTALLVIAFSIFDLIGRTAYRLVMSWSMITACYLVVISGLTTLRVRHVA